MTASPAFFGTETTERKSMPEIYFQLQWPDGEIMRCYSPSTIVGEYFEAGTTLTVDELMSKSSEALRKASDRVEAKFGFQCTSAAAQLEAILVRARHFQADQPVRVLSVERAR